MHHLSTFIGLRPLVTLVAFLFLVAMPFAPSSFLFLVAMPGAPSPSSVLALMGCSHLRESACRSAAQAQACHQAALKESGESLEARRSKRRCIYGRKELFGVGFPHHFPNPLCFACLFVCLFVIFFLSKVFLRGKTIDEEIVIFIL